MSSDLPGVDPATLNGILVYYRLMSKWSGLGGSTELSRVGLPHYPATATCPRPRQGPAGRNLPGAPRSDHRHRGKL
jgi:hypothetical protein